MSGLNSCAYLGLGGNIGDPERSMALALSALDRQPDIAVASVSSPYRTPPWGKTDQPDFLNAVARITTQLAAKDLLARCLAVETELKRVRKERWGPRSIDIDILWFDGRTIEEPGLIVPHPRMLERAFVLIPLAEIAPDLVLDGQIVETRAQAIQHDGIVRLQRPAQWWRVAL